MLIEIGQQTKTGGLKWCKNKSRISKKIYNQNNYKFNTNNDNDDGKLSAAYNFTEKEMYDICLCMVNSSHHGEKMIIGSGKLC